MISTTRCGSAYSGALKHLPLRIALCFLLLFASFSCKDSPSASDNIKVSLTLEDASCLEAWLRLKIENASAPYSVALSRDGNILATLNIFSSDTLLVDEGLAPSTTYTYRATLTLDNNIVVQSSDAPARTLDTTSHNWVFDPLVLLGDGGSSVLNDIAIINDTLAVAVGEIYVRDSTGQIDPIAYSVAKWNGTAWSLQRLYFGGASILAPIRGIYVLSPNEIWLAAGSIFRWDGVSSQASLSFSRLSLPDPNATVEKLWGTSSLNLYGVGDVGTILRYNGTSWTRLESGTTLDVYDIYGIGGDVIAVAAKQFVNLDRRILRLTPGRVDSIPSTGIPYSLNGVWFTTRSHYVVGAGMYSAPDLSSSTVWKALTPQVTNYYLYTIRGQGRNDIVSAGGFGEFLHFNGVSWRSYRNQLALPSGSYRSVFIRDNLCIAVGYNSPRATVVIGRRSN